MKTFSLNICGVPYTCTVGPRDKVDISLDAQGECNVYHKTIVVCTDLDSSFDKDEGARKKYMFEVIMHEIAHAFLYETGQTTLANDECMPEWMSVNVPKVMKCAENFAAISLGEFDSSLDT